MTGRVSRGLWPRLFIVLINYISIKITITGDPVLH